MFVRYPAALLLLWFTFCGLAFSQDDRSEPATIKTEDQWIAEAMWSLIDFGSGAVGDPLTAFDEASQAFPQSSRIAYWRGRFRLFASNQSASLVKLSEAIDKVSESLRKDVVLADPATQQKIINASPLLERIGQRLKDRLTENSSGEDAISFEAIFHEIVARDPSMFAAWGALIESSDPIIAILAAEAWSHLEPDNALPFYAKAIVLQRQRTRDEPIDPLAIEALEMGNTRPTCRVPDEPWPEVFELRYPDSLPPEWSEWNGKPVSRSQLRLEMEQRVLFTENMFGGNTLSGRSLFGLGSDIRAMSHRLSLDEDVRYLRAYVGVGIHMIHSNRCLYGLSAGEAERMLQRLETIAINQEDFSNASEIVSLRDHLHSARRKVAEGYHAITDKNDPFLVDQVAMQIMESNHKNLLVPMVDVSERSKSKWVISKIPGQATNMVGIELFGSYSNESFVCGKDQDLPSGGLRGDALTQLGYQTLGDVLDEVRARNRNERRSLGIALALNGDYLEWDVFATLSTGGYQGRRDPCVLIFRYSETLEYFRQRMRSMDVTLAQILPPGGLLDQESLQGVSDKADLIVGTYSQLITSEGKLSPVAAASQRKFIISGSDAELLQVETVFRENPCIIGTMSSDLMP